MGETPSAWAKAQGLTGRTTKRLAQHDIETARDFMSLDEETVMGWKQTGKTVWDEISAHQKKLAEDDGATTDSDESGGSDDAGPEDWDPLLGPAPTKSESATEDDPAEEEKPRRRRRRSKSEEDEDETDMATEATAPPEDEEEEKPKRGRRKADADVAPQGANGDSVVGLINWAIDAAAYDKKLCRDLLVKAREKLAGS